MLTQLLEAHHATLQRFCGSCQRCVSVRIQSILRSSMLTLRHGWSIAAKTGIADFASCATWTSTKTFANVVASTQQHNKLTCTACCPCCALYQLADLAHTAGAHSSPPISQRTPAAAVAAEPAVQSGALIYTSFVACQARSAIAMSTRLPIVKHSDPAGIRHGTKSAASARAVDSSHHCIAACCVAHMRVHCHLQAQRQAVLQRKVHSP